MKFSVLLRRCVSLACLPIGYPMAALRPGARILMYHRVAPGLAGDQLTVSPENFDRQMAYLARRCRVRSLSQVADDLKHNRARQGDVAITFDDGYLDNLTHALPILKKYNLPATIFVTTGFCDQSLNHPRYPASAERLHLTWDEVRLLAGQPGITIGSHTLTHPFLSRLPEAAALEETAASRARIAREIGREVAFFCYPSGDVTEREAQLVERSGYAGAVTVAPGLNRSDTPRALLHRTEMTDADSPWDLAVKLKGGYDPVHALLHLRRRRKFARAAALSARTN